MFGGFFFGLVGIYIFYYTCMIGYDLYTSGKEGRDESVAHEVDISGTASSYVAKDVRSMFDNSADSSDAPEEYRDEDFADEENIGGIAEYIGNDYQEGIKVDNLTEIFYKEAQTPSLFSGINMAI